MVVFLRTWLANILINEDNSALQLEPSCCKKQMLSCFLFNVAAGFCGVCQVNKKYCKWALDSPFCITRCVCVVGFPTERDSASFWDNGTELPSLSRDKGTKEQAKNLAKGWDGPGQPKFGPGRARTTKIRDGTRDKMGQSRKGCSKTGNGCSETGKDVLQ